MFWAIIKLTKNSQGNPSLKQASHGQGDEEKPSPEAQKKKQMPGVWRFVLFGIRGLRL